MPQALGTYSNLDAFCPSLDNAKTCVDDLDCLLADTMTSFYNIRTLYNSQCVDEENAGPYPYYEVSTGKCQGGTESEIANTVSLLCQASCNDRVSCLGFATDMQTCYLYADSIADGSVAVTAVTSGKCYEKVTDLCVASDCNDKGTASGRHSDANGCQCVCVSGWAGNDCSEQLKVKQGVSYKDISKSFVESNIIEFRRAYATLTQKDLNKIIIAAIRELLSGRRRLATDVVVDYEVEVDTVEEKTETVQKVTDDTFAEDLSETLETQESIEVVVNAVEVFAECTRAADCTGHGSTTDTDTRDGCECTCDEGWTVEGDCSVPVPPPTMQPTAYPTANPTSVPTKEPTDDSGDDDSGDANTSTSEDDSGAKTYMYAVYGAVAVVVLLACYCVVSRYSSDSGTTDKEAEVEMGGKRSAGTETTKGYYSHAPDDTSDLEQFGGRQAHDQLTE